jgi:hypothetical protein
MNAPVDIPSNVVRCIPRHRPGHDRIIAFKIRASSLKEAVLNAYLDRLIDAGDVEDVFREYGLRRD